ncbi:MAG: 2Fe-2S iron-sulfur cluster-binding protein [Acidibrevibacterium sp.]|uniref:2Fe-2S iron-sulfur cluster-binding protein n=1 Tax=Acidibrevibacterium sp. TaxID=2606776 RepID=UPI003D0497B7
MPLTRRAFHRLTLREVRRESPSAVSLAFAVPPALSDAFRFTPGQYLTLRHVIDGVEVRRSYSICSAPGDGELRIAVKHVPGGRFSTLANTSLAAGDEIEVATPAGRFGLATARGAKRVFAAFAAGSGITPILSQLRAVLGEEPESRFFLAYGAPSGAEMMFRDALLALKNRAPDRFAFFPVLSRERQDLDLLHGRLDADKIARLLRHAIPAGAIDHALICGPAAMAETVVAALQDAGVPEERIRRERFSTEAPAPSPVPPSAESAAACRATVIIDGASHEVPVAEGESVLAAGLRAGLDLPYACRGGMCCSCRARLVSGAADMALNYSLEPWELAAGFILTCQAHPRSAAITVDYDEV